MESRLNGRVGCLGFILPQNKLLSFCHTSVFLHTADNDPTPATGIRRGMECVTSPADHPAGQFLVNSYVVAVFGIGRHDHRLP